MSFRSVPYAANQIARGDSVCAILVVQVQRCTLLSIKTGGCPETCNYCSQSSSWSKTTGTKAEKLMELEDVYQVGAWGV
jgi:hypothetical protein